MTDARQVALHVLRVLEDREAFLQPALEAAARRGQLNPRDRRLALTLVQGVMRWRGRLDYALEAKLSKGLAKTKPSLRDILRIATFQLLMLDRVPAHGAVNAAVDAARRTAGEGGARFVNGVLRAMTRQPPEWPQGETTADLSVRASHPEWLVARWIARYGYAEAAVLADAHNQPAPLTIRPAGAHTRESLAELLTAEGATVTPTAFAQEGLVLEGHAAPFDGECFRAGAWFAQDEASQLVVELLDPQPTDSVWEACAAPGGKSRAIARCLSGGTLLATDLNPDKVRVMKHAMGEAAEVRVHDATTPLDGQFDRVLVDAPCTALGVIRRHPEIKWRRTLIDVEEKAALQGQILNAAAGSVKPGGVLVYSVCSDTAEEGPQVVAEFLASHPEFAPDPPTDERWAPLLVDGALQTHPARHNADAFFAVRLRRAP